MKTILAALAVAAVLAAGAVQAQDALKAGGCLGCHDMDKKKIGPSYKDIAAKYKGNKDAESMLLGKMKDGKGHPKVAKSDAEIKAALAEALAAK
jgi:cytochrome c